MFRRILLFSKSKSFNSFPKPIGAFRRNLHDVVNYEMQLGYTLRLASGPLFISSNLEMLKLIQEKNKNQYIRKARKQQFDELILLVYEFQEHYHKCQRFKRIRIEYSNTWDDSDKVIDFRNCTALNPYIRSNDNIIKHTIEIPIQAMAQLKWINKKEELLLYHFMEYKLKNLDNIHDDTLPSLFSNLIKKSM